MLTLKKRPARPESKQATHEQPTVENHAEECCSHEDAIRILAYQKWQEAGSPESDGVAFWLAAEAEIVPAEQA